MAGGRLPFAETAEEFVDIVAGLSEKGFSDPPHLSYNRVTPWLFVWPFILHC